MPGLWCSLQLLFGFLAFSGHSAHSRHKAMVVNSRSSSTAALGSERLRLAFLCCSRQRPSCTLSISVIFMSAVEYFQAIPFKHYLLAVKKIDPSQALEFLKRSLKIAPGARQLQLLGNWTLGLHFCWFSFQHCSWKSVPLPLLETDAKGRRHESGPSFDLGSHLAIWMLRGTRAVEREHVKLLNLKKTYPIVSLYLEMKIKLVGFVMQIIGSKSDKILLAGKNRQKTHQLITPQCFTCILWQCYEVIVIAISILWVNEKGNWRRKCLAIEPGRREVGLPHSQAPKPLLPAIALYRLSTGDACNVHVSQKGAWVFKSRRLQE